MNMHYPSFFLNFVIYAFQGFEGFEFSTKNQVENRIFFFVQILYLELQLPVNGDPSTTKPIRTLGPSRRVAGHQKAAFSTSKEVLEKLKSYHPLPAMILEWRRISSALTKQVYPLQKAKEWNNRTAMFRIFGESQLHTATGRISMSEPNLQNIPKDFEITWSGMYTVWVRLYRCFQGCHIPNKSAVNESRKELIECRFVAIPCMTACKKCLLRPMNISNQACICMSISSEI